MKQLLYLFVFLFSFTGIALAQEDDDPGGKLRHKMVEYIQEKLSLSKSESEKFQPLFLNYLKDLRETKIKHRSDRLVMQQKIAELRLRYREQFKPIMGEKKSNEVYRYEQEFVNKVRKEVQERRKTRQGQGRANKRN